LWKFQRFATIGPPFKLGIAMPRTCALTGKQPKAGRSYTFRGIAKKKKGIGLKVTGCTNRRFIPNLKKKRVWIPGENRWVTMTLSTAAIRTMDKKGVVAAVQKMRKAGARV
jgi:large subunit ribosomal protein L28